MAAKARGGPGANALYVLQGHIPARPPPPRRRRLIDLIAGNLFDGWRASLLTVATFVLIALITPPLLRFLVFDAVWSAPDGAACRAPGAGACWAFIWRKLPYFTYGSYPLDQRWRVDVTLAIGAVLIFWLLWLDAARRNLAAILFFGVYPVVAFLLLHGAPSIGLPRVASDLWGGIFVSLLVAIVGMVVSLPFGVLLALGRRSSLPALSIACASFIELVRGVPIITVLFMANTMLPLFVPENLAPDRLLRPLIGVALFASAYMAEVVRGGLQAIPSGQFEGAEALGLGRWQTQRLVILPQALRAVIPGVVNNFIALFKDTTLVAVVGIFDFLRTVDSARLDPVWAGPTIATTGYAFAAMFYFVFCFAMSRYSLFVERRFSHERRG
ncbi:polar amino acid ABC transporter, inner membrane subunit [Methylocella silvestris BL2]|uniref:Polar amino acid ABC transporter, inner membrane subunit n=1 Tax=Methylocella silvestris (strain DSM 15510 / CIP 108128 / LMG 27833 / NCIMB 13906 / BL2) TaxID=395965 RepID=B8EKB0_METSB|nr:amino acid ABC transporter permease [Methylocella silvestris]ACK50650.1 polar amino acid ABC transporter, inner membrane subunit [Methylocella silvestris BL2]